MAGEFQEATRLSDSREQKPRDQNLRPMARPG